MSYKKFTDEEEHTIIHRYQAGESIGQVAKSLGCRSGLVRSVLIRHNIPRRTLKDACTLRPAVKRSRPKKPSRQFTKEEEQQIIQRYSARETLSQVARSFGASTTGIRNVLVRHGIARRTTKESCQIAFEDRIIKDGLTNSMRLYRRRKAAGLCGQCGRRPPVEGMTTCGECLQKEQEKRAERRSKGLCPVCGDIPDHPKKMCAECLRKIRTAKLRLKDEVIAAYGGYRCNCCGTEHKVFLCIDHVNNDGAEQRRAGIDGVQLHRWLKKNGFPEGYQVLCFNCNFARQFGPCPCKQAQDCPWV